MSFVRLKDLPDLNLLDTSSTFFLSVSASGFFSSSLPVEVFLFLASASLGGGKTASSDFFFLGIFKDWEDSELLEDSGVLLVFGRFFTFALSGMHKQRFLIH